MLPPAVAGAAGIIAATVGIRRAGTAVSAVASSVVFGVGAPEHAMGHVVRAEHFVYSSFELENRATLVVITPATVGESNTVEKNTQSNKHTYSYAKIKSYIGGNEKDPNRKTKQNQTEPNKPK